MSSSIYTLNHGDADNERQRLDFQHGVLKAIMGGDFSDLISHHLNKIPAPKVADVATGSGIFLKELASKLPEQAELEGFDIDSNKFPDPSTLPANVKLQLGNVLEPFPERELGKYDLVHVKLLYAALKKDDWLLAVQNLRTLLKPGGYLFWSETGAYGFTSNPYSAAFYEWKRIESKAAVTLGRDPKCPVLLPLQFRQAGFDNVDEKVFISLGRPDLLETINKMSLSYMLQDFNGILNRGVPGLDLTKEKANALVKTVTKETEAGLELGTNFHWVWGQNPAAAPHA